MSEHRDRIAYRLWCNRGSNFSNDPLDIRWRAALADADDLIAAGVVADPATLGHAYDKIAELSRKGDEAVRERDRYRAALHDIEALHYETDIKTGPGETYRGCDDDWEPWPCATHEVLARHGIDTEEPQP